MTPRNTDPHDALETIEAVVRFMCEALCVGRDLAYSDDALSGARHVFWALGDELLKVRKMIIKQPE